MLLECGRGADRDPAHGPGDDLRPDRPAAPVGADRAPARRGRRSHVLVRCDRGARRRLRSRAGELQELVERDFLVREPRSTIRGEEAYRFKHVLIRDVAYAGLPKSSRALLHRQMARLARRRARSRTSSSRSGPTTWTSRRSSTWSWKGGCRPSSPRRLRRHSSRQAAGRSRARRTPSLDACSCAPSELEPTLERRYLAARAAWRMTDFPTVSTEMLEVSEAAACKRVTAASKGGR